MACGATGRAWSLLAVASCMVTSSLGSSLGARRRGNSHHAVHQSAAYVGSSDAPGGPDYEADDGVPLALEHSVLQQELHGFQLTGGRSASLREINGGALCVGPEGKVPSFYEKRGRINMENCAQIAALQPGCIGFRWGRHGFNRAAYEEYARPNGDNSGVELPTLFAGASHYTCTVYVGFEGETDTPIPLKATNLTTQFGFSNSSLHLGRSEHLCSQRTTLERFFNAEVDALWFCYLPTQLQPDIEREKASNKVQACIFIGVCLAFCAVLGWIMRDLPEFETPLLWLTRFLVSIELGLASVAILIDMGFETTMESVVFGLIAVVMTAAGTFVALLPYHFSEAVFANSPFNTFYLMALSFSPCGFIEFMSYYSAFPLLLKHLPLLVGVLGFALYAACVLSWGVTKKAGSVGTFSPRGPSYREMDLMSARGNPGA